MPDTDSLYDAKESILESEMKASKIFNAERTIFSAGGCTLCIQTMLKLTCSPGDTIIADRNSHRSLINTLALLDVNPIWLYPEHSNYFPGRIKPSDVRRTLENNSNVKAVYITSPNYFGIISDVKAISDICHNFNVPLLVDNAHGSHLYFINEDFRAALSSADLVSCSLHKTLPVLTGGAVLNINNPKFLKNAKIAMSLFASTSPSYPIMVTIDTCIDWLENCGQTELKTLESTVSDIISLAKRKGFHSPSGLCDPLRIALNSSDIGFSGHDVAKSFRANGIEIEYETDECVVLIATPFNSISDFNKLKKAIGSLEISTKKFSKSSQLNFPKTISKLSIRESVFADSESIPLSKAFGRISSSSISTCPPGIPLIVPGEIISQEIIDFLKQKNIHNVNVVK